MHDAIVSPHQSDERSHEPRGQAEGVPTPLDACVTLQYNRITQDRHIRVLDLAPGIWDDPVTCSLRTVSLDDNGLCYEAISYAWGDLTDRKTIICNGCNVSTTRSLFQALQRFRLIGTTRTLWADALCINQADNAERTSQVRLMSFVYTRALRVLVWLQHEDGQVVLDALNAICRFVLKVDGFAKFGSQQACMQQQNSPVLYRWRDSAVTSVSGTEAPEVTVDAMDALHHICYSPWFERGWVIQEVALGTSVSVAWGHAEIGFEWLGVASNCGLLASHYLSTRMLNCYYLFRLCPSRSSHDERQSCFSMIYTTSHFIFSEPKDRIYGLLGLKTLEYDPSKGQLFVEPNYNITTMECYRRAAGKLLSELGDLRVLSRAGLNFGLVETWPSWVPDWKGIRVSPLGVFTDAERKRNGKDELTEISETTTRGNPCIVISGFKWISFTGK